MVLGVRVFGPRASEAVQLFLEEQCRVWVSVAIAVASRS